MGGGRCGRGRAAWGGGGGRDLEEGDWQEVKQRRQTCSFLNFAPKWEAAPQTGFVFLILS